MVPDLINCGLCGSHVVLIVASCVIRAAFHCLLGSKLCNWLSLAGLHPVPPRPGSLPFYNNFQNKAPGIKKKILAKPSIEYLNM